MGFSGLGAGIGQGISQAINALIMPRIQQSMQLRALQQNLPQIKDVAGQLGQLGPVAQQLAGIRPQQADPIQQLMTGLLMQQFGGAQGLGMPQTINPIPPTGTPRGTPPPDIDKPTQKTITITRAQLSQQGINVPAGKVAGVRGDGTVDFADTEQELVNAGLTPLKVTP